MRELAPGDVFAGHRIEAVIGAGGMGVVYRAVHLELERPVALKLIAPARAVDAAWRTRFRRESRLAAALDHPAILTVYDSGEHDGLLYVTMRLVEGGDLGRRLAGEGALAPAEAVALVEQLASALDAAHARGLVHRDVKPANVLLEPPRAFLGDFGLAREIQDSAGPTATGQWVGSVDYAAPEQISEAFADARSDVYALAGVLFAALNGRPPFPRDDVAAVMWAHVHDQPPALGPDGLPAFDDVVAKGMAKDADERFQTAGALAAAARAALEQPGAEPEVVVASAAGVPSTVSRRLGGRSAALAALAVLAIVGSVLLFVLRDGGGSALDAAVTVDRITLPGEPVDVAMASGTPWVAVTGHDATAGAIVAIDHGRATKPVRLPAPPVALAADDDALWVLLADGSFNWKVQRLDAHTNRPIGLRIALDAAPHGASIAATSNGVWISDPDENTLLHVDSATSRAQRAIKIPAGVAGPLAVGRGTLWVLSGDPHMAVTPVDLESRAVGRPITVGGYTADAVGLAVAGANVWTADPDSGAIRHIDEQHRKLAPGSVTLEPGVGAIAFGDGALWALAGDGRLVRRIDPDTAALRGQPVTISVAGHARLALGGRAAWITDAQRRSLLRLRY